MALSEVTYFGFLSEQSGYGVAARRHLLALDHAGVQVKARSLALGKDRQVRDVPVPAVYPRVRGLAQHPAPCSVAVVQTTPGAFPGARARHAGHLVGFTVWETEEIPGRWLPLLRDVDALWAPSRFSADALRRATGRPVAVVPHPQRHRRRRKGPFPGIPDGAFVFLSVQEWQDRKNPDGLIRAFCRAFSGRNDVVLVLKLGLRLARDRGRVLETLRGLVPSGSPPVVVLLEQLSALALRRLFDRADAYVSLHRAEGFGLGMAEAMASGIPVVATAYSGNLEYMDDTSALLVPYRLIPAQERLLSTGLFGPWTRWAEPEEDAAIAQLRACLDPDIARRVGERGQALVRERLDFRRIGATMRATLEGR
ncbi:MAG: glycosyltransferase family 4 protein [Polyangiaceae bacterium]|jgi:glycosyltransferase involved in cell wall biosynthesis|nr:glycosyltransferase family 4 protein [Polyangiaceae bacterium]